MINVNIPKSAINTAYIPYLKDETETQIYYGGSSSGKSYFLAERVVYDLMQGKRNYLICRKVGKYVMKSVWIEVENVINTWAVQDLFDLNKSDRSITCINGKQAIFTGLDEPQKLKSIRARQGAITDVWIEEATEIDASDIKELEKRQRGGEDGTPKRMTLSFNPILQSHWIYKIYFERLGWTETQKEHKSEKLHILKTTYKDNRFLTQQDIERLETETDKYYYEVYSLGNWGILGGVIFTNWLVADLLDETSEYYLPEDQRTNRRNGLDFGFSSDPAAIGVSHYDTARKTIYFFKELYETDLTNDILAERIKDMIGEDDYIVCDSAEPKSIRELQNAGVNAIGAKKGKDSVNFGIDWLKQQTIIVHKDCINMQTELQQYHWKKDAGGNNLKIPVDKNNHLIDGGLRYAYEGDMFDDWLMI